MRGLASAFVVIFILAIITGKSITALGALALLFLFAVHRMHRYGRHYATELFLQFLAVRKKPILGTTETIVNNREPNRERRLV
jgi:hypothetical protein